MAGKQKTNKQKTKKEQEIERLLAQQVALVNFSTYAFHESDLQTVLTEAARVVASALGVPYAKVLRHRTDHGDLLLQAGVGWHPGVVGHTILPLDIQSPPGRAFITSVPVITKDLRKPTDFILPDIYREHSIVSSVNVLVGGVGAPAYGVLEVDSNRRRNFDKYDINFLTGFSNILAEVVATVDRVAKLEAALAEKETLSRELQHRVRNNLQLVGSLLNQQAMHALDDASRHGFQDVARRVMTLAEVYDHLLHTGLAKQIDFSAYLKSLCGAIKGFQNIDGDGVELICTADQLMLDIDSTTALGIIVNELVTNSFEHAFTTGGGRIEVILRHPPGTGQATLTVRDNGVGLGDLANTGRLGVRLVRRLVAQLDATLEIGNGPGASWTIYLTVPPPEEA